METNIIFQDLSFRYALEETINESDFFKHHHTQYEILFILRGAGSLFIENHAYAFTDNTIFLIPPGWYHVLRSYGDRPYERYVVNFSPELLPNFLLRDQSMSKYADEEILALFKKLQGYSERFPKEPFHLLLRSFLTEFLLLFYADNASNTIAREDVPELIRKAMDFINANLSLPLDIETIAGHLFVSRSHLNHSFQKVLNTGVMQYVRIKKMCEARKLLQNGTSATQTAAMLGYKNYTTFFRNYRAEFDENPVSDPRKQ